MSLVGCPPGFKALACFIYYTCVFYLFNLPNSATTRKPPTPYLHTLSCGCLASGAQDSVAATAVTPLYAACRNGHPEVAKVLLKVGANTELAAPVGWMMAGTDHHLGGRGGCCATRTVGCNGC